MFPRKIIKSVPAFLMLLLFSLSITPKLYLHNLLVEHRDQVSSGKDNEKAIVEKPGFDCGCNTLVATAPYLEPNAITLPTPPITFTNFNLDFTSRLFSSFHSFFELRGPPSMVC